LEKAEEFEQRLRALASAFTARTKRAKAKITRAPTPLSDDSDSGSRN